MCLEKDQNNTEEQEKLYKIRHSLAHILAQAVLELRPDAKLAFGPPVDNGFYYDFDFDDKPLVPEDFPAIEAGMKKIIKERQEFQERQLPVLEAISYLEENGEVYKTEYAKELHKGGEETLGFYKNGTFEDMCRGPHLFTTAEVPKDCFKIDSLAGAYWRGDEKNKQLTRVYGLAFENKKALKAYLELRRLAEERDHRKLGAELSLYVIDDDVGQGLPLWLPNGTVLKEELEKYAKEMEFKAGFQRVSTPHLTKEKLYHTSGHLPYYKEGMYPPMQIDDGESYYLKPMNCPHHHKIFAARPRSYRDLPLRFAEYGTCYRYEQSGSLAGLLRVRMLSMNDAHIYCRPSQLKEEFASVLDMHKVYYEKFRLSDYWMRLSLHDPKKKDKFVENPEAWKSSENTIREVLEDVGLRYEIGEGEAAFYGPKVDFQIKNVIGREETASTNQLDFAVPEKFGLTYKGEDGKDHTPYCIHRAPLGTHERFIAFLIEHFGGAFPTWLSPVQVKIVPVAEKYLDYATKLENSLKDDFIRTEIDTSSDSFNKKIRNAITSKTPNILILGEKEESASEVTWRRYVKKKEQQTLKFEEFKSLLVQTVADRAMDNFDDS